MTTAISGSLKAVGSGTGSMLLEEQRWLHRRVETIDILGSEFVRRRVSLDIAIPAELADQLILDRVHLVPLAALRKAPLRNFDLRGPTGAVVPAVTKAENGEIALAALVARADRVLRRAELPTASAALLRDLRVIATGTSVEAAVRLARLPVFAAAGDDETHAILADDEMVHLLKLLADNYILFAVLTKLPPRVVVKMSYEHALDIGRSKWSVRLGRQPLQIEVDTPGAAGGVAYHAEVVVPEEVRIRGALLYDRGSGVIYGLDGPSDRAAVYATDVPRDGQPTLLIGVSPERAGFPILAAALSSLIAVALIVGAAFAGLDPKNSSAAVTVLLAGSAFLSGAVARTGEHRLVKLLFGLGRALLVLAATAGLAAALSLALYASQPVIRVVWIVSALAAAIAAATLIASCLGAASSRRDRQDPLPEGR